jgi:hypothetical protein
MRQMTGSSFVAPRAENLHTWVFFFEQFHLFLAQMSSFLNVHVAGFIAFDLRLPIKGSRGFPTILTSVSFFAYCPSFSQCNGFSLA